MSHVKLDKTVFDSAIDRVVSAYKDGHRIVVSFSAGKDSGICLEICRIAAGLTGNLPLDVLMRDEEIMIPGTYEYAERIYNDPEIRFRWVYQPVSSLPRPASHSIALQKLKRCT